MSDELFDEYDAVEADDDGVATPRVHGLEKAPPKELPPEEIWGERAEQLVAFIKKRKPPIATTVVLGAFARGRNWEAKTLIGVLEYCEQKKLLTHFKSINGAAWKIPLTPIFDDVTEQPSATAPTKEKAMTKEWITTAEAAELLGMSLNGTTKAGREGRIESKPDGEGARAPRLFKRASVIAFRDKKSAGDLLEQKPKKPRAAVRATVVPAGELAEDVRALVRCVERGWVQREELVDKLRELVGL